jgi:hypothetical protein
MICLQIMSHRQKAEPIIINLDDAVDINDEYRNIVWTGKHLQMTTIVRLLTKVF